MTDDSLFYFFSFLETLVYTRTERSILRPVSLSARDDR